jgi:hypothetical protein
LCLIDAFLSSNGSREATVAIVRPEYGDRKGAIDVSLALELSAGSRDEGTGGFVFDRHQTHRYNPPLAALV